MSRGDDPGPDYPLAIRRALQRREPEALERFYEDYFQRIYGYVRRLVRDEHEAEDLTQDVFMHLHRSFASYDPQRGLRPWVFTIATNKVRDFWGSRPRRERARQISVDDGGERRLDPASGSRGPTERLEGAEVSLQVAHAVHALPEGLRTTLLLRYYEGMSFAEIGAVVERSEVAVRKRYSRALEELRGLLVDVRPGGSA